MTARAKETKALMFLAQGTYVGQGNFQTRKNKFRFEGPGEPIGGMMMSKLAECGLVKVTLRLHSFSRELSVWHANITDLGRAEAGVNR